ncbi:MAG: hypothetical protein KF787_06950 [Phycisphaeraceae bacterium]|nr:hypothetical protein [Phycisphaerae bacterium]MBX3392371.1 hypothetical protein [Phycisphaeraceae bacterium]
MTSSLSVCRTMTFLAGPVCLAIGRLLAPLWPTDDSANPWRALAMAVSLAGVVSLLWFVHSAWSAIHDRRTAFSPELAAFFLLIPIVNCYWVFRVIAAYPKDHNAMLDRQALPLPRIRPGGVFVWSSMLLLLTVIPYIGAFAAVANTAVAGVMILKTCAAIERLRSFAALISPRTKPTETYAPGG